MSPRVSIRGHLWAGVVAAVALHAAVLAASQCSAGPQEKLTAVPLRSRVITAPSAAWPEAEPALPAVAAMGEPQRSPRVKADNAIAHARRAPKAATVPVPAVLAEPPRDPGLPPAPEYLSAAQLDPGPSPLHDIEPAYPIEGELREGAVVLRLLINELGGVDNAAVVEASPKGLFESAAIEAFGRAQFSPGKLLGVPVKSQVTIEVRFTPLNRGATVSGRSY